MGALVDSVMLAGLTEDEQLAQAIALSLQDTGACDMGAGFMAEHVPSTMHHTGQPARPPCSPASSSVGGCAGSQGSQGSGGSTQQADGPPHHTQPSKWQPLALPTGQQGLGTAQSPICLDGSAASWEPTHSQGTPSTRRPRPLASRARQEVDLQRGLFMSDEAALQAAINASLGLDAPREQPAMRSSMLGKDGSAMPVDLSTLHQSGQVTAAATAGLEAAAHGCEPGAAVPVKPASSKHSRELSLWERDGGSGMNDVTGGVYDGTCLPQEHPLFSPLKKSRSNTQEAAEAVIKESCMQHQDVQMMDGIPIIPAILGGAQEGGATSLHAASTVEDEKWGTNGGATAPQSCSPGCSDQAQQLQGPVATVKADLHPVDAAAVAAALYGLSGSGPFSIGGETVYPGVDPGTRALRSDTPSAPSEPTRTLALPAAMPPPGSQPSSDEPAQALNPVSAAWCDLQGVPVAARPFIAKERVWWRRLVGAMWQTDIATVLSVDRADAYCAEASVYTLELGHGAATRYAEAHGRDLHPFIANDERVMVRWPGPPNPPPSAAATCTVGADQECTGTETGAGGPATLAGDAHALVQTAGVRTAGSSGPGSAPQGACEAGSGGDTAQAGAGAAGGDTQVVEDTSCYHYLQATVVYTHLPPDQVASAWVQIHGGLLEHVAIGQLHPVWQLGECSGARNNNNATVTVTDAAAAAAATSATATVGAVQAEPTSHQGTSQPGDEVTSGIAAVNMAASLQAAAGLATQASQDEVCRPVLGEQGRVSMDLC